MIQCVTNELQPDYTCLCVIYQNMLSEVGFEPTPTEVDCDLNAAP